MLMTVAQAQSFEDRATDAEFDAYLRASDAAAQPALHPDQFRFLLAVMLPHYHAPTWCVATVGIDHDGRPALDDAWIFLPGREPEKKRQGDDFNRIRLELIGSHYQDLVARIGEIRTPRGNRAQPFSISTADAAPLTIDEQIARLDVMLADYHAEKRARPVPNKTADQALEDLIAALPAPAPAPPLGSALLARRASFGPHAG